MATQGERRLKAKKAQAAASPTSEFTSINRRSDSSKDFPRRTTRTPAHDADRRTREAHAEAAQRKTSRRKR